MKAVRFCAGGLIYLIFSGLISNVQVFGNGYDSTYVLAVKQKYAIPENVANGDYVGVWLKTWTWMSNGTISFSIEKNFNNAFAINSSSGLITVSDYTKINGKIVQQDTIINIIIRSTDASIGFELDTAQVWVKENSFCVFVDYKAGSGTGSRTSPLNNLSKVTFEKGKMYCLKRGNIIIGENILLRSLVSSAKNPLIICAYGAGNKPVFATGKGICFDMDTRNGEAYETSLRSEYLYFYDIMIRDYAGAAYKIRRKGDNMGWYNCETYNCDKEDVESSFLINTSSYADSSIAYCFELINYKADTTSYNLMSGDEIDGDGEDERAIGMRVEPSFMKIGVGPVNIINSYFGKSPGQAVRYASGVASTITGGVLKHCYFDKRWTKHSDVDGRDYYIQVRQDNLTFEDCRITGGNIGIFVTSAGDEYEMPPDNLTVKNCYFKDLTGYGIWLADNGTGYKEFYNTTIEDNYMLNVATGIRDDKGINTVIRRNVMTKGKGSGINTVKSSVGMRIYYNVLADFTGNEIYLPVGSGATIYNNTVDGEINCNGTTSSVAKNNFYKSLAGISSQSNNVDIDAITPSEYFENYTGRDYRLKVSAKNAIDKGTNVGLKYDLMEYPVVGLPDIGAFEFRTADETESNNPPEIENHEFLIREDNFSNLYIGKVYAYDSDAGQQITYSLISGNESGLFVINSLTGDLRATTPNIFTPGMTQYILNVQVTDDGRVAESNSATITINLEASVETNSPPEIENQKFLIQEQDFSDLTIGTVYAYDNDAGQQLTYSLISGNESGFFVLDSYSGVLKATTSNIFSAVAKQYVLTVQVTDDGDESESNSATVTVNLAEQPTTFYIDPGNKNDTKEDGSLDHPFDSWSDISWKEGNTYLQKKGTTTQIEKINIFANNVMLGAYGDGELPVIISETNSFIIRAYEKVDITISSLHLIGRNAVSCIYFIGASSENITIEKCELEGAVNGVRIVDGNNVVLKYNTFYDTEEAIYSYAQNTEVYYNIFTGNNAAINITSSTSVASVYNNVFYDNRQGVTNSYAELTLYNNIFYMTRTDDIAINDEFDKVISDHNIFYPEQSGFIKIGNQQFDNISEYQNLKGIDLNSFSADPRFVDAYNMNFSLREESPAIDAGKLLGIKVDYSGVAIPLGDGPDIGINELMGVSTGFDNVENVMPEEKDISVYPNPSSGVFEVMIKSDNISALCPVQILDLSGRLLYTCYANSDGQGVLRSNIDLSGAPSAIYFVQATVNCQILTERIIIR
ncbi:MAG: cadherin domain-containing protein [Bacteroidales bacterium]|nr:cadherin domain-containing protein [Bacteroidales bacterium]